MKTALGRGLEALIPQTATDVIIHIDIERITTGLNQPRKTFRDETLRELAASIKEKGVLQPIIVTRDDGGSFRLVAGERRWRASRLAGLKKIPAIIKDATPEDSLEIALIENIQREDLNPIETANAFNTLMKEFRLTQEALSGKVGKDRATVANYLRLLRLPDEVKSLITAGRLSMGHAKALGSIDEKKALVEAARKIATKGLSVREAEALSKRFSTPKKTVKTFKDPQIKTLEDKLIQSLGTKVRIRHRSKRGVIEIEYYSLDELQRLLDVLMG